MKNIHLLPTDKPSKLYLNKEKLFLKEKPILVNTYSLKNQNIYITSDEKIKEGDWVFNFEYIYIVQYDSKKHDSKFWYKKIILTTDQDLIKDGVQAISDDFLEWFVKNPSCEFAHLGFTSIIGDLETKRTYKIIIPKEEPKQETLEEAAEKFRSENPGTMQGGNNTKILNAFKKGAKWQAERMYSEKDIIDLIQFLSMNKEFNEYSSVSKETARYFLEQFKKK